MRANPICKHRHMDTNSIIGRRPMSLYSTPSRYQSLSPYLSLLPLFSLFLLFFLEFLSYSTTTINMLHVQESFINSNLLMTPPMTVIVQPQPSSSSRSNKVIEQLSNKYELIQKDLAATRAQVCYKSLIFITHLMVLIARNYASN